MCFIACPLYTDYRLSELEISLYNYIPRSATPQLSEENTKSCTYDVAGSQGHEYAMYSEVRASPIKTGGRVRGKEFNLNKCAAYGPVNPPQEDQNTDYEFVASTSHV